MKILVQNQWDGLLNDGDTGPLYRRGKDKLKDGAWALWCIIRYNLSDINRLNRDDPDGEYK